MPIKKQHKRFLRKEDGSFTLEATLIFPILITLVLLFIFFSLVIYEKVTLHYKANQIASQLAHSWSNSSQDIKTGATGKEVYVTGNGDGLYWRLTGNNILSNFGLNVADSGLVEKKIAKAGDYAADVTFEKGLFSEKINVTLEKKLALPDYVTGILGIDKIEVKASYPIIEQVERIRDTDFMLYGFKKFKKHAGKYIPFFNGE